MFVDVCYTTSAPRMKSAMVGYHRPRNWVPSAETPEQAEVPCFMNAIGQNTALCALPAAAILTCLLRSFNLIHPYP